MKYQEKIQLAKLYLENLKKGLDRTEIEKIHFFKELPSYDLEKIKWSVKNIIDEEYIKKIEQHLIDENLESHIDEFDLVDQAKFEELQWKAYDKIKEKSKLKAFKLKKEGKTVLEIEEELDNPYYSNEDLRNDLVVNSSANIAGAGSRLLAYLIDITLIVFIVNVIAYFIFNIDISKSKTFLRYISFSTWVVYCIFLEASPLMGTFGKKMVGIKVCDTNGNPLNLIKSLQRNMSKFLSFIPLSIGFIWILFEKKKRGWHDLIAKTLVVNNMDK